MLKSKLCSKHCQLYKILMKTHRCLLEPNLRLKCHIKLILVSKTIRLVNLATKKSSLNQNPMLTWKKLVDSLWNSFWGQKCHATLTLVSKTKRHIDLIVKNPSLNHDMKQAWKKLIDTIFIHSFRNKILNAITSQQQHQYTYSFIPRPNHYILDKPIATQSPKPITR